VSNEVFEHGPNSWTYGGMEKIPISTISNESEPEAESQSALISKEDITVALVERVSERVAKGVPLRLAAAREGLSRADYEECLRRHPELALRQDSANGEFVEFCIRKLLDVEDPSSNIRWLLERLNPDLFADRKARESGSVAASVPTIVGMTEEELRQFREAAKRL
jgi:hypothetical protein